MKGSLKLFSLLVMTGMVMISCEGPMGPTGPQGAQGPKGEPGTTVACTECHNPDVVEAKVVEYDHSVHFSGEAFEEGTRNACAPCHSDQGFRYVVTNNTPVTFVPDPANAGKFLNSYSVDAITASLPGPIGCMTCHSALHSTYSGDDFSPLTTTAEVPMTMWGGSKSINFAKAKGNLCTKCHQPRPVTASSGNVIDYCAAGFRSGYKIYALKLKLQDRYSLRITGCNSSRCWRYPVRNRLCKLRTHCKSCVLKLPHGRTEDPVRRTFIQRSRPVYGMQRERMPRISERHKPDIYQRCK